jgi:hypothetical protein
MDARVAGERALLEQMLDVQRAEVAKHSRAVAAAHEVDEQFPWHHGPVSLRFVDVHMIAELARHAGHGDILAEQLRAEQPQAQAPGINQEEQG